MSINDMKQNTSTTNERSNDDALPSNTQSSDVSESLISESNQVFVDLLKNDLHQLNQSLNPSIVRRLESARTEALRGSKNPLIKRVHWPALAAAISAITLTGLWYSYEGTLVDTVNSQNGINQQVESLPNSDNTRTQLQDFALLSSEQELAMIEQLEFYRWLEQQELGKETSTNSPESS